jgi:hypothetical protein
MLESWLDRVSWPIAVVASVLIFAFTLGYLTTEEDKSDLKKEIVRSCKSSPDPVTCANNLTKALSTIK